jgi:hypothetical protein
MTPRLLSSSGPRLAQVSDPEGITLLRDCLGILTDLGSELQQQRRGRRVLFKDLIDRMEELESDKIKLDYPPNCSHCEVEIEGFPFTINVTSRSLSVQTQRPTSPKLLVQTFFDAQRQLIGTPVIRAISAGST